MGTIAAQARNLSRKVQLITSQKLESHSLFSSRLFRSQLNRVKGCENNRDFYYRSVEVVNLSRLQNFIVLKIKSCTNFNINMLTFRLRRFESEGQTKYNVFLVSIWYNWSKLVFSVILPVARDWRRTYNPNRICMRQQNLNKARMQHFQMILTTKNLM